MPSSTGFRSVSGDSIPFQGSPAQAAKHVHNIINGENFKLCKADSTVIWHIVDLALSFIAEVGDPCFQKPVHLSGTLAGHQLPNTQGCIHIVLWY